MSSIWIQGKQQVHGAIEIQGCKNAVLPMMAAALLTDEEVVLENCPRITDVGNMIVILQKMGCDVQWNHKSLRICNGLKASSSIPVQETKRLRASGIIAGALAAGGKTVILPETGGCVIGKRPMDLHICALKQLGYSIQKETEYTMVSGYENARAGRICFAYPSVGATENAILASVLLHGETVICGAAKEPEIIEFARLLNKMGAHIQGAGEECIYIQGVKKLHGTRFTVMPDRIVAGTYLMAAAATLGTLELINIQPQYLAMPIRVLRLMGYRIETDHRRICIYPAEHTAPAQIKTGPYPEYPTDLQSVMMPVMLNIQGRSMVRETVFENRMGTVDELIKMGADIRKKGSTAIIHGSRLRSAVVSAPDLRGGAALVIAALTAEGVTEIQNAELINRGYEDILRDLRKMNVNCCLNSFQDSKPIIENQ